METAEFLEQFVIDELAKNNFKLVPITEEVIQSRLDEIMSFVNTIRNEGNNKFGWQPESKDYFLNPMDRKFKYSLMIENEKGEIIMMSFISVYDDIIHSHCTYTHAGYRSFGLAKLLVISYCAHGARDGFTTWGGYFPKNNNGSIILFLKFGVQIQHLRGDVDLYAKGDLLEMANNAYKLYHKEKK